VYDRENLKLNSEEEEHFSYQQKPNYVQNQGFKKMILTASLKFLGGIYDLPQ
jgi:hypothetical protein